VADGARSIVQVRLTPDDRDRVRSAAKRGRRTGSAWLRALVLDALQALEAEASETGERKRGKRK